MKRHILDAARATGLLPYTDRLMMLGKKWSARSANRAFAEAHPDFVMPPDDLCFDAYNHVDCLAYWKMGQMHAEAPRLSVLEWGCGPGRIIRHLRDFLPGRTLTLTGTDCNARSIEWCASHIPDVQFAVNAFLPPLPFADNSFDVTYNYSVFTHLSEASQLAWSAELLRVLKPGGLVICTTHGNFYSGNLAQSHQAVIRDDRRLVVQEGYEEGKKWYLSFHPEGYVQETLLAGFVDVREVPVCADASFFQCLWAARKA
jgi:ubiquinone/menaquinone biosynthesis C-methylase UbiE